MLLGLEDEDFFCLFCLQLLDFCGILLQSGYLYSVFVGFFQKADFVSDLNVFALCCFFIFFFCLCEGFFAVGMVGEVLVFLDAVFTPCCLCGNFIFFGFRRLVVPVLILLDFFCFFFAVCVDELLFVFPASVYPSLLNCFFELFVLFFVF